MFVHNGKYHSILEAHYDVGSKICAAVINSWTTADLSGPPDTRSLCSFVIDPWTESSMDTLESVALLHSWTPYSKDAIPSMLTLPPTFAQIQSDKSAAISATCAATIIAGFSSNALGSVHHYPSNDRDQVNLSGSILRSNLTSAIATDTYPFLCADQSGMWDFRPHTAAQIQQVGTDAYNAILAARVRNGALQAQVQAATTVAQLDLIIW